MVTVHITSSLRAHTAGQDLIHADGSTVGQVLTHIAERFPGLRAALFGSGGQLRGFVGVFVNEDNIRAVHGLETRVTDSDRITIVHAIAGG